jgi:F0F1-type ATP synthase delta subunit
MLMVALPEEAIEEVINALKENNFGLKVEDSLTEYLSCKSVQKKRKKKVLDHTTASY